MERTEAFFDALAELLQYRYDSEPTKTEAYAEQLKLIQEQFVKRNIELTSLLEEHIRQQRQRIKTNNFFKKFIFWLFVALLVLLTLMVSVVFYKADLNSANIYAAISIFSIAATYLGSLISIFMVMSKYLFPVDEEKDTIKMIEAVIKNDVEVEKIISRNLSKNTEDKLILLKSCKDMLDNGVLSEDEYYDLKQYSIRQLKNET